MRFYSSLSKGLTLNVGKFWEIILTFVEVTGEKLVGRSFYPPLPHPAILNRVQVVFLFVFQILFLCLNRAGPDPEVLGRWQFKGIGKNVNVSLVY